MRKEAHERQIISIGYVMTRIPIDIDQKHDLREREERDSKRQISAREFIGSACQCGPDRDEEPGIFEIAENAKVECEASHQGTPSVPALLRPNSQIDIVIDRRGHDQNGDLPIVPPRIEE